MPSSSWKRADHGDTAPPTSSRLYALPLRFTWLLIGIAYFFPGLWKLWRGGFQWIYGDNLQFLFYSQWHDVPGYLPFFRIDQYPLLYRFGALGAILFELSFIFLIFLPRIRPFVVVNGLVFHRMNAVFMRVTSFWSLEACYVAFFDWHTILGHVGRWLFREDMHVVYDGNCKICRRTIASLRRFDLLGRITYVNALDEKALSEHNLLWLDAQALATDMHAVVGRKAFVGFASYRALAARIPLMWPLLPFLYLPPIPAIGSRVYRRVADSRTCSISRPPSPVPQTIQLSPWRQRHVIVFVGGFLLLMNVICGFGRIHSWPFACYPTFDGRVRPQRSYLVMAVSTATGEQFEINPVREDASAGEAKRLPGTISNILRTRDDSLRQAKFEDFWRWMSESDPRLQDAVAVTFYVDTVSTVPEQQDNNLIERKMVYQLQSPRRGEQSSQ
ncbi:MAG: DCC1-like thiol-disulfide oxidoreductase family protein [Pyrinomonadaceae bacterium]